MATVRNETVADPGLVQDRLRVAAIMDPFTLSCFAPEVELFELAVDVDLADLVAFRPDFLFVESAFFGKDRRWHGKIAGRSAELMRLLNWFREKRIPTVFWNKEDPVHFNYFVKAAREFDHVFTTNIDCIPEYKRRLRHDRVHLLPFAAQPRLHNPIETSERRDAVSFAGSYYVRFPDRAENLKTIVSFLSPLKQIEIYDRHWGDPNHMYRFPPEYDKYVRGTLSYDEIDKAYKGTSYSINLNSVKQSTTMFSRRMFELLASNAIVIGNFSRGVRLFFGDVIISSDDGRELLKRFSEVSNSREYRWKLRLAGLRKVGQEHLYAHRVAEIARPVLGRQLDVALPHVLVVAYAGTEIERDRLVAGFQRQTHERRRMVLVCGPGAAPDAALQGIDVLGAGQWTDGGLQDRIGPGDWVAVMASADYYGPNYLLDLLIAARLCSAPLVGKIARYSVDGPALSLLHPEAAYRQASELPARAAIIHAGALPGDALAIEIQSLPGLVWRHPGAIGSDPFNYCENGAVAHDGMLRRVGDLDVNSGVSINRLLDAAGRLKPRKVFDPPHPRRLVKELRANLKRKLLYARDGVLSGLAARKFAMDVRLAVKGRLITRAFLIDVFRKLKARRPFDPKPGYLAGSGKALVVTNMYPRYSALYSNFFVHTRVRSYIERGLAVDVFCLTHDEGTGFDEFEGVDVARGSAGDLDRALATGQYKTILVHFLTPAMWSVLKQYATSSKIIVWVHGFEIQPYFRRISQYPDFLSRLVAKFKSDQTTAFWQSLTGQPKSLLKLVFVSRHFAGEVMEDLSQTLSDDQYRVIHNPIDVDLYQYRPKPVEQRLRILSIRPFKTNKYANDITVRVILALSERPLFDRLEFRIVGDGYLFKKITEPVRRFPNVTLEQRFLSQAEIAALHQEFGIFLCPSRWDSQGVSRDEAMASGMVPITNDVAAIPEFVDSSCGVLVPAEDVRAMADAIEQLVADPDRFLRMSEAAALRVRRQSALSDVIAAELALINEPASQP